MDRPNIPDPPTPEEMYRKKVRDWQEEREEKSKRNKAIPPAAPPAAPVIPPTPHMAHKEPYDADLSVVHIVTRILISFLVAVGFGVGCRASLVYFYGGSASIPEYYGNISSYVSLSCFIWQIVWIRVDYKIAKKLRNRR